MLVDFVGNPCPQIYIPTNLYKIICFIFIKSTQLHYQQNYIPMNQKILATHKHRPPQIKWCHSNLSVGISLDEVENARKVTRRSLWSFVCAFIFRGNLLYTRECMMLWSCWLISSMQTRKGWIWRELLQNSI